MDWSTIATYGTNPQPFNFEDLLEKKRAFAEAKKRIDDEIVAELRKLIDDSGYGLWWWAHEIQTYPDRIEAILAGAALTGKDWDVLRAWAARNGWITQG